MNRKIILLLAVSTSLFSSVQAQVRTAFWLGHGFSDNVVTGPPIYNYQNTSEVGILSSIKIWRAFHLSTESSYERIVHYANRSPRGGAIIREDLALDYLKTGINARWTRKGYFLGSGLVCALNINKKETIWFNQFAEKALATRPERYWSCSAKISVGYSANISRPLSNYIEAGYSKNIANSYWTVLPPFLGFYLRLGILV